MKKINDQQMLFTVGLNHKTASIEVREKLYIHKHEVSALLAKLRETLSECLVLSTCNRTEIYGVCDAGKVDLDFYIELLINFKNAEDFVTKEHFFTAISNAACQQFFNVATGIDSQIIGDAQILQQLKDAYFVAKENNSTGRILNQLSQRAFKIGKKVYTETAIHKGAVSVSLAAVQLAVEHFGSLQEKSVLIIGAGETAKLTAECLIKRQVGRIFITNRTRQHAQELLQNLPKKQNFESKIIDFTVFKNYLNETDIIISSTGSSFPILKTEDFSNQTKRILLIDIATPRDVAPEVTEIQTVSLKNIDDLRAIIDYNYTRRMKDLSQVQRIILEETGDFLTWYYSLSLMPFFEKTDTKPDHTVINQILKLKEFLNKNISDFYKSESAETETPTDEWKNHLQIIEKLQTFKNIAFEGLNA